MTSLLAGTVAHGARGGRGVSTSHHRRTSRGLSGTPQYSPELPGNGSHNTFFKIKFLKINHPGPPLEYQTVWIQIKTDIMLVFIWVQTVCKRLLTDDKIIHWHAKSSNR